MAGLISEKAPFKGNDHLSPDGLKARMKLPPQMKAQLEKVVLAGMKFMFDDKTHGEMMKQLQGPGPMAQKLAEGVAGLMGILVKKSNGSMPPQLVIPGGLILLAHAREFLMKSGADVTDEDFGQATQQFIDLVLAQFKIDPQRLEASLSKRAQPPANPVKPLVGAAPEEAPAEAAPEEPVEPEAPAEEPMDEEPQ